MKEYIDREAACAYRPPEKRERRYSTYNLDDAFDDGYDEHIKQVEAIPAADVRSVVKSKWVKMKFFPDWECEKCGSVISGNTPDPWNHYHYCPNCGADMREES